jgi:hypothetical protein
MEKLSCHKLTFVTFDSSDFLSQRLPLDWCGTALVTISVVVIMFELTGALAYILPTMIVVGVTKAISDPPFPDPLLTSKLHRLFIASQKIAEKREEKKRDKRENIRKELLKEIRNIKALQSLFISSLIKHLILVNTFNNNLKDINFKDFT